MARGKKIAIFGGGPGGLAAGYYARQNGIPFTIYEASGETGGNCRTLRHKDFLFDTGAHRFHDKDAEVTELVKTLMKDQLREVNKPSQIFHRGRWIDFPLSPLDLLKKLGPSTLLKGGMQILMSKKVTKESFQDLAVAAYGQEIASRFLLNYSEKLWGLPCSELSPLVAGKRLRGLDLRTFLLEGIRGKIAKTRHLDGTFYYPEKGIGCIFTALTDHLGKSSIETQSPVKKIRHSGTRIVAFQAGDQEYEADTIINSLPLTLTLNMLEPQPPEKILELSRSLQFRHLVLAVVMLDRPYFSPNASVYFPDPDVPFTRLYESKNRSEQMAPPGQTSVVIEIPCFREDIWWNMPEQELRSRICNMLLERNLITKEEILDFVSYKVPFAYPVLDLTFEEKGAELLQYLEGFSNMYMTGRSGMFQYTHIHDMFRTGKSIVNKIRQKWAD